MPTDDGRRSTAALSRFLSGPDGTLALARMQVLAMPATRSTDIAPPQPAAGRVGVWRRDGDALRRDPGLRADWRYWADHDEIALDPDRTTVAVVGESAARGYFFDPEYSLAGLVAAGLPDIDVLDLARTNCSAGQLLQTVADACALGVDALVVYAGNNWNNVEPEPVELQELAALVDAAGVPAATAAFRELVGRVSAAVLDAVRALAGDRPVVLVVPEFNLADWTDEPMLDCPVLPQRRQQQWQSLRERAESALADGDAALTARLADQMLELDGGASPVTYRLRGAAAADDDGRLLDLEAARDSVVSPFALHSPRILTSIQRTMRESGPRLGFTLVDQPALFRAHEAVPGRRHFLDYCHLTFEGLTRTAEAVAGGLSDALPGVSPLASAPPPQPGRIALAHFLAAVHNAHYGQQEPLLRHHLRRALELDPDAATYLEDYLDYQTRRAPNWMCASYERSARNPAFRRYLVVGDGRLNGKLADHLLRRVMVEELTRIGRDPRARHDGLLRGEHAGPADLLADAQLATTFAERAGSGIGPAAAYLRSARPSTVSTFVVDDPAPCEVRLTWRLPRDLTTPATVALTINEHPAGNVPGDSQWRTDTFAVDPGWLRPGLNTAEIRWPRDGDGTDTLLDRLAERLECGEVLPSHPVFGHVHAWTVTEEHADA